MPFTPSHAILAIPFVRTPLAPAAVAVGAMTPDLPLFTRGLIVEYVALHDLTWILLTTILSLALLLVWWIVLRPACPLLAPRYVAARLPREWNRRGAEILREEFGSFSRVALLVLATMIGIVTHIVWDAFTHEGRAGLSLIPALEDEWGPLPGYKWLQYGCGVGGVIVLAIAALMWLRRRSPRGVSIAPLGLRITWWASLPVALTIAVLIGLGVYGPLTDEFTVRHLAYRTLPLATGVWGLLTVILVVVLRSLRAGANHGSPRQQQG